MAADAQQVACGRRPRRRSTQIGITTLKSVNLEVASLSGGGGGGGQRQVIAVDARYKYDAQGCCLDERWRHWESRARAILTRCAASRTEASRSLIAHNSDRARGVLTG